MSASAGTMVPGVSRRMARTQRSLAGPRSCGRPADHSSIGPRTRNSMIAFASSTTDGGPAATEWDPRNLSIDFNTRHDLFTPRQEGEWRRNKKMFTLVRRVNAIFMDPFMESHRLPEE